MYKVLVVDDKEVFRKKITRMKFFKNNSDFKIAYTAKNGVEALEVLRSEKIDVLLTDISMPMLTGLELLEIVKDEQLCDCTLLVSEYVDFEYAKQGIVNGALDYLVKPINEEKLEESFVNVKEKLGTVRKEEFHWVDYWAEKIANAILKNSVRVWDEIGRLEDEFRENDLQLIEQNLTLEKLLNEIKLLLISKRPYVEKYVDLQWICIIDLMTHEVQDGMVLFRKRVMILVDEVNKFEIHTDDLRIVDIVEYGIYHVQKDVSMDRISKAFYMNKKYLSSLFKKETNEKYKDFITRVKIERAKVMLLCEHKKVYEIAAELGFSDIEYFSRVFKKITGVTPTNFKWEFSGE